MLVDTIFKMSKYAGDANFFVEINLNDGESS